MDTIDTIAETERLILRKFRESDLEDLFECLADPETVKFEPYLPMSFQQTQEALNWRISSSEMVALELKENHKMIGNIFLGKRELTNIELGFLLNRKYWGKGYAFEAGEILTDLVFKDGAYRIFAECDPRNVNSWRLLEKLGFKLEAHLQQNVFFWRDIDGNPIWKDTFVYAKLNSEG